MEHFHMANHDEQPQLRERKLYQSEEDYDKHSS